MCSERGTSNDHVSRICPLPSSPPALSVLTRGLKASEHAKWRKKAAVVFYRIVFSSLRGSSCKFFAFEQVSRKNRTISYVDSTWKPTPV